MGHGVRDTVRSVHIGSTHQSVIPCPLGRWLEARTWPVLFERSQSPFDTLVCDTSDIHDMLSEHKTYMQDMGRRLINISERFVLF